jgi:hypothetical protein
MLYFLENYCQSVWHLSLSHNPYIHEKTLQTIAAFGSTLSHLDLSGCWQLSEASIATLLSNCNLIRNLNMSYLHKIKSPEILEPLRNLQKLKLNYCDSIDDAFLSRLNISTLTHFELTMSIKSPKISPKQLQKLFSNSNLLCSLTLGGLPVDGIVQYNVYLI